MSEYFLHAGRYRYTSTADPGLQSTGGDEVHGE